MACLSVIVPVFNEALTLTTVLDRIAWAPLEIDRELLVVDDGSTDESLAIARAWASEHSDVASAVLDEPHAGKGAAVRAGIHHSSGNIVIIHDADLEYDPADHQKCIQPILSGECHVVYGSREVFSSNRLHSSLLFYAGGLAVTAWMNLLYGSRLTDEPTCLKTFDGDLIRSLRFEGDGFEWEPEITGKLLRLGFEIREVPVSYTPRKVGSGKKLNWRDGLRALTEAARWRFRPIDDERLAVDRWRSSRARQSPEPAE